MTISVPNQFAGTATSDVSALDANFDALVNFLNSGVDFQGAELVSSYVAIRALTASTTSTTLAFTTGRLATGDGGMGWFRADPSDTTSSDNDGTILVAADGMRWKRLLDGVGYFAEWWGAKSDPTHVYDSTSAFAACFAAANADAVEARAGPGDFLITKSLAGGQAGYTNYGRNNLHFRATAGQTLITSNLTEAYPVFDLIDSDGATLADYVHNTLSTSLEICQVLETESSASHGSETKLRNVKGYIQSGAVNALACVINVSADQPSVSDCQFTSYQSGAYAGCFTQANVTGVTSKYGTVTAVGADTTYLSLDRSTFVATDQSGLRVDNFQESAGSAVYVATIGSSVANPLCQFNPGGQNIVVSINGLRTENQTSATQAMAFGSNGAGLCELALVGALLTDSTAGAVVWGGTAYLQGSFTGTVTNAAFLFEGGAQPIPALKISNTGSHSLVYKTLPTTLVNTGSAIVLPVSAASAAEAITNTVNISGGKIGSAPWVSPAVGVAYPGNPGGGLGHPNSTAKGVVQQTTTTGAAESSATTFLSTLLPLTSCFMDNPIQGGATPAPFLRVSCRLISALASGDTASLSLLLGTTAITTITVPYDAAGNMLHVELLFQGVGGAARLSSVKITIGGTILYAHRLNGDYTADQNLILQQSSTVVDPFAGSFTLLCEYV